jgi:hypothetical protein
VHGKKTVRKQLKSHVHQGKKISGVWELTVGPDRTQCIEVYTVGESCVDRVAHLADSENNSAEACNSAHEHAVKRVRMNSSQDKDGQLKVTVSLSKTYGDDDECDDALIDMIFRRKPQRGRDLDEDDDATAGGSSSGMHDSPQAKKQRVGPTPVKIKVEKPAAATGTPTKGAKSWTKSTLSKALDESEQVTLKCRQFLTSFEDDRLIVGVTAKSYEQMVGALDKRLTTELVSLYTANYSDTGELLQGSPANDSRGMHLFSDLRSYQQKLQALKGLILTIQATSGYEATAAALRAQYQSVKTDNIAVSSVVLQMITARAVKQAVASSDFAVVVDLLHPKSKTNEHGLHTLLDVGDSTRLQKSLLVEVLFDFLKVEPEKSKDKTVCTKNVDTSALQLRSFLNNLPWSSLDEYLLDANFRDEIIKFQDLANAPSLTDSDAIAKAERSRDDLMNNKTGTFYRGITVFATGLALRLEADKFLEKVHADKAHTLVLQDIVKQAADSDNNCILNHHCPCPHSSPRPLCTKMVTTNSDGEVRRLFATPFRNEIAWREGGSHLAV